MKLIKISKFATKSLKSYQNLHLTVTLLLSGGLCHDQQLLTCLKWVPDGWPFNATRSTYYIQVTESESLTYNLQFISLSLSSPHLCVSFNHICGSTWWRFTPTQGGKQQQSKNRDFCGMEKTTCHTQQLIKSKTTTTRPEDEEAEDEMWKRYNSQQN